MGTALLAKATNLQIDAFSVKAKAESTGAWSARSLAHEVLVPKSISLGIHLGVSGREPLNNQPYFRLIQITPAELKKLTRSSAQGIVELLCKILENINAITDSATARLALRSFIHVRRRYQPAFPPAVAPSELPIDQLLQKITTLVEEASEGGKRAQAVVAGLVDTMLGEHTRVYMGRINDPDRHFPGDVAIAFAGKSGWERAFEVRDKPVSATDVQFFARKAAIFGVTQTAVIAVAKRQIPIQMEQVAAQSQLCPRIFIGWTSLVAELIFWSDTDSTVFGIEAWKRSRLRLIEAEASPEAIQSWDAPI